MEPLPESADDQHQLMALELNAGLDEFDILELDVIWTAEFAQNGWLVDLKELRADSERVSLPVAVQTAVWDGRLWAAPYTTDAGLLYYRSDLVEKPPTTWEELRDVGFRVGEEQGIAPFVADGAQYEGMVVQYLEYFWGAGGDVLAADGRSVLFQHNNALKAGKFMKDAYREGFYAPGFDTMKLEDARDTFQSGQGVHSRVGLTCDDGRPSAAQGSRNRWSSRVTGQYPVNGHRPGGLHALVAVCLPTDERPGPGPGQPGRRECRHRAATDVRRFRPGHRARRS